MYLSGAKKVTLSLPAPHPGGQDAFFHWSDWYPTAQVLVAPCGTKLGKSFGCSLWMVKEAWSTPRLYCAWIGPTYLKCKIGYRYMKAMLPAIPEIRCVDSALEIHLPNGSFIKFLHGKDAETTVEGEAVDRFVIDESGKQSRQLWYSLFTTITQTRGKGIVTGTPRGFTWYYELFRKAKKGDPMLCWAQLATENSPFVDAQAIEQARRLLPKALFDQYYRALFVSQSTVFGDISGMFDESLKVNPTAKFWVHPDKELRKLDTVTGWDIAKHRDYSVFFTVTTTGKQVGYARFRKVDYNTQVDRLKFYMENFFPHSDKMLRFDATGVGSAVGDMLSEKDIDAATTAVIFSNKSKQEMVSRTTMAIESQWLRCPRIEQVEHEFGSYEVNVTKSGLFSYSAPDGEHDDCVSAGMLAITGAYQSAMAEEAEKVLEDMISGKDNEDVNDDIVEASKVFSDDDFFEEDSDEEEDFDFSLDD